MEILIFALLLATIFVICSHFEWRPLALLNAWLFLVAFAALSRVVLNLAPEAAPIITRSAIWVIFLVVVFLRPGSLWEKISIPKRLWPFVALGLIVLFRSAIPQFDTDSLAYHLSAISWLFDRDNLPFAQFSADLAYVNYRFIGVEEFLLIPLADADMALWGGLLSGLFKFLTLLTLVVIVPRRFILLPYLAAFLLFIDDHFLFSAHSRNIYLNPQFIALIAFMTHFLIGADRGRRNSLWYFVALSLCLVANKYHGLVVLAIFFPFFLYVLVRVYHQQLDQLKYDFHKNFKYFLPGLLGVFAVYGLNLLETGSPLYPFGMGLFYENSGSMHLRYLSDNAGSILAHQESNNLNVVEKIIYFTRTDKYKLLTYSGNLALKLLVLCIPIAVFLSLSVWSRKVREKLEKYFSFREVYIALFIFLISIAWVYFSYIYSYVEARYHGRYPRYVYATAILGICYLISSIKEAQFNFGLKNKLHLKFFQHGVGILLLVHLIYNFDSRYYNVPPTHRASMSDVIKFWSTPKGADRVPMSLMPLHMETVIDDALPLKSCFTSVLAELNYSILEIEQHLNGKNVILVEDSQEWPNYYLLGNAVRAGLNLGIDRSIYNFDFIVIRKNYFEKLWSEAHKKDAFLEKINTAISELKPSCESAKYNLYRI